MKYINGITLIGLISLLFFSGCKEDWDDHYKADSPTVDQNVWEAVQNDEQLSSFVQHMKDHQYDTLFESDIAYTLFIPTNQAFSEFNDTSGVSKTILNYHISAHFIQSGVVNGKRKIQTLAEKFALFERYGSETFLDGQPLSWESPLYRNGKYFIMDHVARPRPNLYEYFAATNPILRDYIDSQDSIILDREKSKPIGFDEDGNTIYDTVSIIYNEFEEEFFPVREELRYKTATIVFPRQEDYNDALDVMAQSLGSIYQDHNDIPLEWQNKVLIPYLLEQGVFENMMEEHEFIPLDQDTFKLKNILGDSIIIDYMPTQKTICSNGYAYNYTDFTIPDTLFSGSVRIEGESLIKQTGVNKFTWRDSVEVNSDIAVLPGRELIRPIDETKYHASNDSILKVNFPLGYSGGFNLEFSAKNLFPRKYLMVVSTNINVGGVYDIYVNDELVTTIDYDTDFTGTYNYFWSVTGEYIYAPNQGWNRFDCWVFNNADYGKAKIRFEYKGPSDLPSNGLTIDYIDFIPYD